MDRVWNLDDPDVYFRLLSVRVPYAHTWGARDRDKREDIRRAVAPQFPRSIPPVRWWAFRLYACKRGGGWDVENVPKLVLDAFSKQQIQQDRSAYPQVGLYEQDTIEYVRMVQVAGEPGLRGDFTVIEVFGAK